MLWMAWLLCPGTSGFRELPQQVVKWHLSGPFTPPGTSEPLWAAKLKSCKSELWSGRIGSHSSSRPMSMIKYSSNIGHCVSQGPCRITRENGLKGLLHSCGQAYRGITTARSHSHPWTWRGKGDKRRTHRTGFSWERGCLPSVEAHSHCRPTPSREAVQAGDTWLLFSSNLQSKDLGEAS